MSSFLSINNHIHEGFIMTTGKNQPFIIIETTHQNILLYKGLRCCGTIGWKVLIVWVKVNSVEHPSFQKGSI